MAEFDDLLASHDVSMAKPFLALLDEPFVFTQRPALTVSDFGKELRERKVAWPDEGQLEAFHRAGLLVPMYSIRYDAHLVRERAAAQGRKLSHDDIRGLLDFTNTFGHGLIDEREVGDLMVPASEGYTPWRRQRRMFAGRQYQTRQYLYSPYQLLATPMLEELWPRLRGSRGGRWRLDLPERMLEFLKPRAEWHTRLIRALTILEPVYLPDIFESVSMPALIDGFERYDQFRADFDPAATLARIGWSAEMVLKTAEDLLSRGHGMDPVANLHELMRLIHPSHWKKLTGTARTAMDYRIAGEILLRVYEDLAAVGAAKELEQSDSRWWHPRHERLKTDRSELDATLTHFGLSPHPGAVLIVEGQVEHAIVPRVLDLLYERRWHSRIRVFNAQGVDQDLKPLAAFAAVPALTESERDVIPLAHHPVRFVVLSDAEGKNATAHAREQRRQKWIERIHEELPAERRKEIDLSELDGVVRVLVWDADGSSFEFAHFTDEELADGLLAIAPRGPDRAEAIRRVAVVRATKGNLTQVWKQDWEAPRPSKTRLADELWPLLSSKIRAAQQAGSTEGVPILARIREVMQIASKYLRHYSVVLKRSQPEANQPAGRRTARRRRRST